MPTIQARSELKKVLRWADQLAPQAVKPAMNYSLNRVGPRIRTASERDVSALKRIQLKLIRQRMRERKSNFRSLLYVATVETRGITWMTMGAREIKNRSRTGPRSKGVRVGSRLRSKHAFIARSSKSGNMQAFVRDVNNPKYDGKRYPLRVLRQSLHKPFKVAFEKQIVKFRGDIAKEFQRDFIRRVNRLNEKASNI